MTAGRRRAWLRRAVLLGVLLTQAHGIQIGASSRDIRLEGRFGID